MTTTKRVRQAMKNRQRSVVVVVLLLLLLLLEGRLLNAHFCCAG